VVVEDSILRALNRRPVRFHLADRLNSCYVHQTSAERLAQGQDGTWRRTASASLDGDVRIIAGADAAEEKRDEQRKALVGELRARFVEGRVLLVPSGGGATFDASRATPIPGNGTVYFSSYLVKSEWGSLEATNGTVLTGDGWTVTLSPGWIVRSGPRPADYQIVREAR
jgi:hypothetical protein